MTQQNTSSPEVKEPLSTASSIAYRQAGTQLQLDMGIRYSGDADKDFAALLAAYGKGVIATARIELQHGKDPALRRLAQKVIDANEKNAGQLADWQAKHK